jgi:hypothetical protein
MGLKICFSYFSTDISSLAGLKKSRRDDISVEKMSFIRQYPVGVIYYNFVR